MVEIHPGGGTTGGSSGTAIDGWSYRVGQSGNNDGDIRGPKKQLKQCKT